METIIGKKAPKFSAKANWLEGKDAMKASQEGVADYLATH